MYGISMKVEFFKHSIEEEDIKRVEDVLQSIFLTTGQKVADFESDFASYLGSRNAVGVTSCTGALHLCLLAYGIGPGDEVITTPMSFCATANAILYVGAKPVFVDVEPETGNMNAEILESAVTERTKAIIPVHLYGQMCDMRKIKAVADKYDFIVIEDAAHAVEAHRGGIRVGELGNAACFSFYATKNITCGEGGAITTNDDEKADALKILRLHGIDRSAADRYTKLYQHWDMSVLGWKYNMDNIQAALLIGQLERIEKMWARRNALWELYENSLGKVEGVEILKTVPDSKHSRHLFTILVEPSMRDLILHELQKHQIGVAVNYRPIHLLKFYREKFGYEEGLFPVAEDIGRRTISLPLYPKLTDEEASHVVSTLKTILTGRQ